MARVLACEDDVTFRELLVGMLTDAGYDVDAAADGQEGWEKIERGGVDLVVADYNMPRLDGIELIKRIRESPRWRHLPVLMLTVRALVEEQIEGYDGGADDYVTKPFDPQMLVARLKILQRRAAPPSDRT